MADPLDWYRSALGGDVGTGIPLNLDHTPVPDTGEGTAWNHLQQAPGDILQSVLGLLERGQLGGLNALGLRSPGSDIYRAQIPVEPGLRAAEGAATFATGGLASSLFPAAGALRAGAQYAVPPGTMPGLLADEMGGIRAFHGSPHDFDRFDLSKIGTGEGAQAYGHGLYFAENEGVARGYRDTLGRADQISVGGNPVDPSKVDYYQQQALNAIRSATRNGQPPADGAMQIVSDWADKMKASGGTEAEISARKTLDVLNGWKQQGIGVANPGRMYEVDINADPKAFLDWDRPATEQSQTVLDALEKIWTQRGGTMEGRQYPPFAAHGEARGESLHAALAASLGSPEAASAALREAGVPGIRYLDQGSRGTGQGTSNYAVGDDSLIQILRKYGLLPPVAGAGLMGGDNQ